MRIRGPPISLVLPLTKETLILFDAEPNKPGLDAAPAWHRWTFLLTKKPNPASIKAHNRRSRYFPSDRRRRRIHPSPSPRNSRRRTAAAPALSVCPPPPPPPLASRVVPPSRPGSRIPYSFAPCPLQIFEYNGSAVVAMVGKNCFAIASDRRLGVQLQTIATDFQRVFKIHDKLYIGLSGLATDAQTL
jgi:hypothetical protein